MTVFIAGIERHSSVNGPGVRYVVFLQGCPHHCPGCHNPDTWDISKGKAYQIKDLVNDIASTKYIDGVTLSGGDPLYQPLAVKELTDQLQKLGINVWCYTGWTYEQIQQGVAGYEAKEALLGIDVLVDGPFVLSKLSEDCVYRGSSNQRLIDVKRSIREGRAVEAECYDFGL